MAGYYYLASPYSKYPKGPEEAFREACKASAKLIRDGMNIYCPIAESHPIAEHGGIDQFSHEVWLAQDKPKMEAADGLVVLMLDGWEQSVGVSAEIEYFTWAAKPIKWMEWTPSIPVPEEGILQEAIRITSGERMRDYDHPLPNHQRIADLWNVYLAIRKDPDSGIGPGDVANMMILLKMARNAYTKKRDNWTDIAGYARCGARIEGFES